MCKELVRLTTQDVSKAIPATTSRIVAKNFNKKHKTVLRDIRKLKNELKNNINIKELDMYKIVPMCYKDKYKRKQTEYYMNFEFYMMLVMGYNTKEAYKVKNNFIKAFNLMKNELQARQETRHIGISVRKSLTDSIKENVLEEGNFKKYAYSNYSKLIYKKVLGKTVKKAKKERGLKKTDNLRNYLTIDELKQVQELESKIAYYIEMRTDLTQNNKEVYQEVKKYIETII